MTSELSCFLLFFTFSLSLQPLFLSPSLHLLLFSEEYGLVYGQLWSPQLLLARPLIDLVGWRGCDGVTLFSTCLLSAFCHPFWLENEWKLTDCVLQAVRRHRRGQVWQFTPQAFKPQSLFISLFIFFICSDSQSEHELTAMLKRLMHTVIMTKDAHLLLFRTHFSHNVSFRSWVQLGYSPSISRVRNLASLSCHVVLNATTARTVTFVSDEWCKIYLQCWCDMLMWVLNYKWHVSSEAQDLTLHNISISRQVKKKIWWYDI